MEEFNKTPTGKSPANCVTVIAGAFQKPQGGFTCEICEGAQPIEGGYWEAKELFPICNECLEDLKELVVSNRAERRAIRPILLRNPFPTESCQHEWRYSHTANVNRVYICMNCNKQESRP